MKYRFLAAIGGNIQTITTVATSEHEARAHLSASNILVLAFTARFSLGGAE
ncbi:host cell division inhibitor Icd-like protein [Ferrimonas balearica]|uniref:host cell division inhibitor Icd-like protein n=1 Tax=Ferrimonas balearica TaxID=44012 RepID=UPI001C997A0D|nr:host cell division inhibitor Icd-like protein [Ferrimonas balearica]